MTPPSVPPRPYESLDELPTFGTLKRQLRSLSTDAMEVVLLRLLATARLALAARSRETPALPFEEFEEAVGYYGLRVAAINGGKNREEHDKQVALAGDARQRVLQLFREASRAAPPAPPADKPSWNLILANAAATLANIDRWDIREKVVALAEAQQRIEDGEAPPAPTGGVTGGDEIAWVIVRSVGALPLEYWCGGTPTWWSEDSLKARRFQTKEKATTHLILGEGNDGDQFIGARVEEHMWVARPATFAAPARRPDDALTQREATALLRLGVEREDVNLDVEFNGVDFSRAIAKLRALASRAPTTEKPRE